MTKCTRCGSTDCMSLQRSDAVPFKGLVLEVSGLQATICNNCSLEWQTEEQEEHNLLLLREAFTKRKDQLRTELTLLTGGEIAKILEDLKLPKAAASRIFGGGPNSFGKYISGEVLQSVAMDRLIRIVHALGKPAIDFLSEDPLPEPKHNSMLWKLATTQLVRTQGNFHLRPVFSLGQPAPVFQAVMAGNANLTEILSA